MKIALIGEAHSGKSTAVNLIYNYLTKFDIGEKPICDDIIILKFADPLYYAYDILTEDSPHQPKNRKYFTKTAKVWKEIFGVDIFIRLLKMKVKATSSSILCDDCRSQAEFDACKKLGFTTIYIDADDEVRKRRLASNNIIYQEKEYDDTLQGEGIKGLRHLCDYVIFNNHSGDYLEVEVDEILGSL